MVADNFCAFSGVKIDLTFDSNLRASSASDNGFCGPPRFTKTFSVMEVPSLRCAVKTAGS